MTKKRILLTLLFLLIVFGGYAKGYASIELSEIGELLNAHPMRHTELRDSNGTITHLGLPLLPHADDVNMDMLFRFIERYALHAKLLPIKDARMMMAEDKVVMNVNEVALIDSTKNLSINNTEQLFSISWDGGELRFPNNYSLISGLNKAESDAAFHKNILSFAKLHVGDVYSASVEATPIDSSQYFVEKGTQYIIKEINTDKYYVRMKNDSIFPIFSSSFPSESLSNLMQQVTNGEFDLHITQSMYGYKRQIYDVPLKSFSDFCAQSGCIPYVGIEDETDGKVKAVVVFRNRLFAYNHLLYVDIEVESIKKGQGIIDAWLYCYIPTHNIKSMYYELEK